MEQMAAATEIPATTPTISWLRLILAGVLTVAGLPYAYGRSLVITMMVGRPEWFYAGVFVAVLAAVMFLTFDLATTIQRSRLHRYLGIGIAAAWVILVGALVATSVGSLIPPAYVFLLLLVSSLWVPWTAWLCYGRPGFGMRLSLLVLFLAVAPAFPLTLKVDGLTGESTVNFAWRWSSAGRQREVDLQDQGVVPAVVDLKGPDRADDYSQFLGPQRLGVVPQVRLARDWEKMSPRLVWRRPVGEGWGAFAVKNGFAVTQEQRGSKECVVCYRVADGSLVWIHADDIRYDSSLGGPGPRATPTIGDGRVYAVGATGLLNCLDGATGKQLWSVHILEDNGGANINHGVCASPLLVDDWVIVCPTGTATASLTAYHRDTGQRVWQGGQDAASYGSPLLAELVGVRQILIHNAEGVAGHDAATGRVLWTFPWTNNEQVNCSQPIPNAGQPGQVFAASGYGKGGVLFRVMKGEDGSWSTERVWLARGLKTKFTSAVLHDSCLYGLDDGILACVDVATGKQLWKEGRYSHGQILLAGKLLVVQAENGDVVLVEPVRDGLRELGRVKALNGKTWNNPALAGRYLLVRNDQEAACYELSMERDP